MATIHNTSLFATTEKYTIGAGIHNIGSSGVLRASNKKIVDKIEAHYGERCGHIPLDHEKLRVLVDNPTAEIEAQIDYLSQLFGKEIKAITIEDLQRETRPAGERVMVVPYVNVPEARQRIQESTEVRMWGLPAPMVELLKNKADFYQLVDKLNLDGFRTPDYVISPLPGLHIAAWDFLARVEQLYRDTGMASAYPLGIVLRAAESDGNYGSCLLYARGSTVCMIVDGDAINIQTFQGWDEALLAAQKSLAIAMNLEKEARIVISRFVEHLDSPGMSVVLFDGHVESLRWNGQLQGEESQACIGTSTYVPRNDELRDLQLRYEDQTADFFISFLKQTAQKCGIEFASIRGLTNLDLILPGAVEIELQRRRKQPPSLYLAECNPRWTNYTDAIMTIIGANRQAPTISSMQTIIEQGIFTFDKIQMPMQVNPAQVREQVWQADTILKQEGTRIICRMTKNPMGMIFTGDLNRAQSEFERIVERLAGK